jgi:hypothetical protein
MNIVRQTLNRFTDDLKEILKDNLHEIIIHGSYALGDFRPNRGDLDYIVVTEHDLDTSTNNEIFNLHDNYRANRELLLHQLEGTFYPRAILSHLDLPFVGCYIGTGRSGWRTITTFQNSYIDLRVIEKKGIFLLGSCVPVYRPTEDEIRTEMKTDHCRLVRTATDRAIDGIGFWCAIVHWCARTICYLKTGLLASKADACRWCKDSENLGEFGELFDMAENRRYPYGDEKATDGFKSKCQKLLQLVDGILSDGNA